MGLDITVYSLSKEYNEEDGNQFYYHIDDNDEKRVVEYLGDGAIIINEEEVDDFERTGLTSDRYGLRGFRFDCGEYIYTFYDNEEKRKIEVKESDIPKKWVSKKVLCGNKIGYQRKGLNRSFYEEFRKEDYFVFDKERLQYVYDHYIDNEEVKKHFKENILDQHVNGETFVVFSW